jgi:hypothetical protein
MTLPPAPSDRTLHIYLSLAQYPILSTQIRSRMRRELFARGVITPQAFEAETREKAIRSQTLEGLHDPFTEEPPEIWDLRLMHVRETLTDFYFAYNLPFELFEQIVHKVLEERGAGGSDLPVSFNPELAPQNMLFEQAMQIEKMPKKERLKHEARLREIKVVLIRTLISDQLAYVKIAKDWFTIADLNEIRTHKIGQGKIGGKAAGMLLAWRILIEECDDDIRACLHLPESYYLGADVTYIFMALNGLMPWNDQKYKLEDQIYADYPHIQEEFLSGEFPEDILERFRTLLEQVGEKPLIVRSSSLLEDNFGTSFAGKYESYFCPNQGPMEQNLKDLTSAIIRIYASMLNPDALLYRRSKGLQDYDERMAILIQVVQGEPYGRYFLPHAAGVAFSRNLYRWTPQIRREDGFLRLVWGLGTRAVDRVGNDYPRLVALSHPLLRPETSARSIRQYSQQYVDLIDLQENAFKTLPVSEVLGARYPVLRYLAEIDEGDYLVPIRILTSSGSNKQLVITFEELLRRTPLAKRMTHMLQILEKNYFSPVDTEFTLRVVNPDSLKPEVEIVLLQCRPQSHLKDHAVSLPANLPEQDIVFSTTCMAPEGRIDDIQYVVFVPPEGYFGLPTSADRAKLCRVISAMNAVLKDEGFICIGPGRWGTSTPDLGVPIGYGDIYHAGALVELTGVGIGPAPEPSFGTHFFQDLIESNIFPLAIDLDDPETIFKREFFYGLPNDLAKFLPDQADMGKCLRLIRVANCRAGHHLTLVMDDEAGKSIAYLEADA